MTQVKTLTRKLKSFTLSAAVALGAAAGAVLNAPAAAVYAADEQTEPNPIQESYVIDGVTYYNAHSTNFNSNKLYYLDLVDAPCDDFRGFSLAEEWLLASLGIKFPLAPQYLEEADLVAKMALFSGQMGVDRPISINGYNIQLSKTKWSDNSIVKEMTVGRAFYLKKYTVTFSDFSVVPILPDVSVKGNYIQTVVETQPGEMKYFTSAQNPSTASLPVTKSVSAASTVSLQSTINHSFTHSYSESLKASAGVELGIFKASAELGFTATQAIQDGWSSTQASSKSTTLSDSATINLPPYTEAALMMGTGHTTVTTKYNCPVALKYKVSIYARSSDNGLLPNTQATFGSTNKDARKDLYQRALVEGVVDGLDPEALKWKSILDDPDTKEAIERLSTHVPMSSSSATFVEQFDSLQVKATQPTPMYPLAYVKLSAPDVPFIVGDEISYGSLTYLQAKMQVGDESYTNYLNLAGYNLMGASYYGFDKTKGHWVITDKDGKELTGEAPVKLEKIEAGGNTKYTAVKPGTCYLKYVIDEDCYTYSQAAGTEPHYTTNAELKQTAALEVTVTAKEEPKPVIDPNKDINFFIKGSYSGIVNADPDCIEGEDKLDVYLFDKTGREIDKDYVWQSELTRKRGIRLSEDGMIVFTKPGNFRVRVYIDDEHYSDWVTVSAEVFGEDDVPALIQEPTVKPDETSQFVINGSYTGKINSDPDYIDAYMAEIDPKYNDEEIYSRERLELYVFDKTGKELPVDYKWEAQETEGIKLDENGKVTFTKPGKYHVRAVSGDYSSEWVEITAEGEDTAPADSTPAEKDTNPNTGAAVPAAVLAAAALMLCTAAAVRKKKG